MMIPRFLAAVLVLLALVSALPRTTVAQSIHVGSAKQLFFDNRFIESSSGVQIVMNRPRKLGPVLKPDRRWEDFRLTSYFTVLQDGDLFRMYYSCFSEDQWNYADAAVTWRDYAFLCYAESKDGIHWHKPNLGIVEYDGSKENNILVRSIVDGTVFIDPEAPADQRYKILHTEGPHAGGLRISTSADGIHFNWAATAVRDWSCDSQQNIFFDDRLGRFVGYLRAPRGLEFPGHDHGEWRMVMRVEVEDPHDWSQVQPEIVFRPDKKDPAGVDFYTNAAIKYPFAQEAYFMFPAAYHHFPPEYGNDGLLDVSAAASRDGIRWQRIDRRPYVPLGQVGEWDAMFAMMGVGMVRVDDKLLQYYNAIDISHGGTRKESKYSNDQASRRQWGWMGAVEQRLDGFYSADAAYSGGFITTPQIVFEGSRLELNINTSAAGSAKVELRDAANRPIEGYTFEDADTIMVNDVRHVVTWKGESDIKELVGKPVRLHIEMRSAKLYAFQFTD